MIGEECKMSIDYTEKIPNNVDIGNDRRLQRALEHWQPRYLDWWNELGPKRFQANDVYLRTAINVGADGWAHFDHVKMPDYRWGIFLAERNAERTIGFGDEFGKPVWQDVPGEHRAALRRLIVTQGDTEPASVEQQRLLGLTCPSLYDLRNLFQVNVEEGRHLWAMVYLLHAHFGRAGREEAEELLDRHSGDPDNPRILSTFNEPIDDWLSFFMFTYFTDRDGKYQLKCLAESSFDPMARTCQFMLTEEAHHMFVGETGIGRIIERTVDIMMELRTEEPDALRVAGVMDLGLLQRYINFWFSSCLDLFGADQSSNAASYFAMGIKGRPDEAKFDDHICRETHEVIEVPQDGKKITTIEVPTRNAMNEITRNLFVADCQRGMNRWNKTIHNGGFDIQLTLPSTRFRREIGSWADVTTDPAGNIISAEEFDKRLPEFMPTENDRDYVRSLMKPVTEPGKMASWIAAPRRGIHGQPLDFEYVKLH